MKTGAKTGAFRINNLSDVVPLCGTKAESGIHFGMDDWGNWRGVRWHDIAFLDATCRVEPKRGHVRALQSRIGGDGI